MTVGSPRERLEELLAPGLAMYCERHGLDPSRWRGPPLRNDEAAGFLRAVDAEIVIVDTADSACTIPSLGVTASRKRYQLYMTYEGGAANPGPAITSSWREMFDQIGFAAELVVANGWPLRAVQLEVDRLDVTAGRPETVLKAPLLGAESKLTDTGRSGLAAMMSVFAELNGTGPDADVTQCARQNSERKYRSIQRLCPAVFVEVAPGVRRAHDLTHLADGTVLFTLRDCVPAPRDFGWEPSG